ncbi:CLUMA_CG006112, isoform A [Clunio marinus]|uniref:CLUMA_CG006112, isoform A n=1 Tax=Clunio marinus TaxID=568069 RepID=A0A1J1I148_9DIPT|nr:CLUMA_CG006112, isoform A [Clunio marinus]
MKIFILMLTVLLFVCFAESLRPPKRMRIGGQTFKFSGCMGCFPGKNPICGKSASGNRTFDNKCELNKYNCENPGQEFVFLHDEPCVTE